MTTVGEQFARALAAKDFGRVAELLHPEVDFRGMTPGRFWEATGPDQVIGEVLTSWFEDQDVIEAVVDLDTGRMVDRDRVAWRFAVSTPDGPHLVEQQAYYSTIDGRISWMRVLCSGFRPATPGVSRPGRPLWTCPRCGRSFANRNQSHTCASPGGLDRHLEGKDPEVVAIFRRLLELAEGNGPVTVLPEKTRIAFQVRMSFAAFSLRRHWVDGHVVLARRLDSPRFRKVETFSPRNHLHRFRLERLDEVDDEVAAWLAEAYRVGEQRHLAP